MGYKNQNTYYIWIPSLEKVMGCRDVTFNETKFFELTNVQQQLQVKVSEVIDFNEVEIKPYMRIISKEEEQQLTTPLHARTAQSTVMSSVTELFQDIPTSSVRKL